MEFYVTGLLVHDVKEQYSKRSDDSLGLCRWERERIETNTYSSRIFST